MANVYWLKGRSPDIRNSIVSKITALMGLEEFSALIVRDKGLALKINLSELGYGHYLPPVIVATLFEKLRDQGVLAVVTDSGALFKGSRFSGYDWMNTILIHGFSAGETFDNQLMLAGGYTNEEGKFCISDGDHLGGVEIGSLLLDTGNAAVLSHVTAHPLLGVSGAIGNLGLGFLTASGKLRIHDCLEMRFDREKCDACGLCVPFCPTGAVAAKNGDISFDARICNNCLGCFIACPRRAFAVDPDGIRTYQECVAEAAATVRRYIRNGGFFINFLTSVTPQTDDYPYSDVPFIPDLGVLASHDPVALDWATYQMIARSPGVPGSAAQDLNVMDKGADKIKAVAGVSPEPMLTYAEKMGLGARDVQLLTSD